MPAYERYTHTYTHINGGTTYSSASDDSTAASTQVLSTIEQSATTGSTIFPTNTNTEIPNTFSETLSHVTPTPTYTRTSQTATLLADNTSTHNWYDSQSTIETQATTICSTRTITTENTTEDSTEKHDAIYTYEASGITYNEGSIISKPTTSYKVAGVGTVTDTLSNGFYDTPDGTSAYSYITETTSQLTSLAYGTSQTIHATLSSDTDLQSVYGEISYLDDTVFVTGSAPNGVSTLLPEPSTTTINAATYSGTTIENYVSTLRYSVNSDQGSFTTEFARPLPGRANTRAFYQTKTPDFTRYTSLTRTETNKFRSDTVVETFPDGPIAVGLNVTAITPVLPAGVVGFGFDNGATSRPVYKTTSTATAGESFSQIPTSGILNELSTRNIAAFGGKIYVTGSCGLPANNSSRTLSWFTSPTTPEFSTVSTLLATHASTFTSATDSTTSTLTSTRGMSISLSCSEIITDKDDFVYYEILSETATSLDYLGSPSRKTIFRTYQATLQNNDDLTADRTVVFSVGSYTISRTSTNGATNSQATNITDRWHTSVMPKGENWAIDKVDSQDTATVLSYYDWDIPWPPDILLT